MKNSKMIRRLLITRNLSKVQLVGFILSNFIGLAIVISGVQFYADIRSIWEDNDSFINQDYLIVNKEVSAAHTLGRESAAFSEAEIADIEKQPWVRGVGEFTSADYEVTASMTQGGRGMSTRMFFESIPDSFIDITPSSWRFTPDDNTIPVIISKDYLTLYNFGFASSSGLPQLTEGMLESIPLHFRLTSRSGEQDMEFEAHIVGFSNRLNTILVPESFMQWSNSLMGSGRAMPAGRLIIDVSSPGDKAIASYLNEHGYERSRGEGGEQAAYFIRIVAGLVIAIGALITFLSFFILLLSVALLMQKNREKIHLLLMLGFDLKAVSRPYVAVATAASAISFVLAIAAMLLLRNIYISGVEGLTQNEVGVAVSLVCGAVLTCVSILINTLFISRKVRNSYY